MTQTRHYIDADLAVQCLEMAQDAQQKIRRCEVVPAQQLYERILNKDLLRLFFDSGAQQYYLSSSGGGLPLDRLAFYLIEQMFGHADLPKWQQLVHVVLAHDDFPLLPANDQYSLHAANIFSQQLVDRQVMSLNKRAKVLHRCLQDERLTGLSRAVVLMVLGNVHLQLRKKDLSLDYLHRARESLSLDREPFYAILCNEFIGSTIYFMNEGRYENYMQAVAIYEKTEVLAKRYSDGYDFTHNAYNLGWVYAEVDELDTAMAHFERGLETAIAYDAPFEHAQYGYGIGYVYLRQEQYDKARESLLKSLKYFMTISHVYSVACLNLLAQVDKHSDIEMAINWALSAKDNLTRIDHPTQSRHVRTTLQQLYALQARQSQ